MSVSYNAQLSVAKELLLEELSSNSINILRIRQICLENPGVIASAGIRIRVWSLFLLGTISVDSKGQTSSSSRNSSPSHGSNINNTLNLSLDDIPNESCNEQHVLDADVKRTRADIDEFRSTAYRHAITTILQSFCLKHNIQYKQGMNEVLAPFIYLNPPPKTPYITFSLFEAFLFRYLERYFCVDDSSWLFKSFRYFQILLSYHDPQLALFLSDNDFYPELYAPQWFLTFYARSLPLPYVCRLWDMIIAVDDTAFMFFIGLCQLKRHRHDLLRQNSDSIPEVISKIVNSISNEQDIDNIMKESLEMYKLTPRCFIRNLRLCCTATVNLKSTTSNYNNSNIVHQNIATRYDIQMSEQSVRSIVMMSPQELITHLSPLIQSDTDALQQKQLHIHNEELLNSNIDHMNSTDDVVNSIPNPSTIKDISSRDRKSIMTNCNFVYNDDDDDNETIASSSASASSSSSSLYTKLQFIIIDLRSQEEISLMGGGVLPQAILLEPDFLDNPQAFDAWLQHFDNMKGSCNVCILDMPVIDYSTGGMSLWRRLLLGEGDRRDKPSYEESNKSNENNNMIIELSKKSVGYFNTIKESVVPYKTPTAAVTLTDKESTFFSYEEKAKLDDTQRAGVKLAIALQRANFPYVSVLEGSTPALIKQLLVSRGSVEPILINHNQDVWQQYIQNYDITTSSYSFSRKNSILSSNDNDTNNINNTTTNNISKYDDNHEIANDGINNVNRQGAKNHKNNLLSSLFSTFNNDVSPNMSSENISNLGLINPDTLSYSYEYITDSLLDQSVGLNSNDDTNSSIFKIPYLKSFKYSSIPTTTKDSVTLMNKSIIVQYSKHLSQLDRYNIGFQVSKKLGHKYMEKLLAEKIFNHT